MSALPIALGQMSEQEAYRNYVTECLRIITENTAKFAGGKYIERSFDEMLSPKPQKSADEIIGNIKSKFRG